MSTAIDGTTSGTTRATIARLDRAAVQPYLPLLDAWLLPGTFHGVQHTWPQLYRSDGDGAFFVLRDGERLVSHCAVRVVTARTGKGELPLALIGSVATDPELRGHGHAGTVLTTALDAFANEVAGFVLWAERPELYARHGFVAGTDEPCLLLARRPRGGDRVVRRASVTDHAALHALHERKPLGVRRTLRTMSTLLTTPGMDVFVLERDGTAVAYACCGKGADLHDHWHELGGSDDDLARLLPAAMHACDQIDAALLLPPYRARLAELLADHVVGEVAVAGPMVRPATLAAAPCWFDGLDSV